eukprot:78823-Chlamydomonas_euryale.AAC.17
MQRVPHSTCPHLVGQLHCRLHECAVIAAVERHAPVPEALEELGQHIGADILRLHTLGAHALLHDLCIRKARARGGVGTGSIRERIPTASGVACAVNTPHKQPIDRPTATLDARARPETPRPTPRPCTNTAYDRHAHGGHARAQHNHAGKRTHARMRAQPLPHLEHNLLHLLVGRLELALQHDHDLARVVERMFGVHERDDEADGLEERSEHLAAQ